MFDPKKLEEIAKQIHDSMPTPIKNAGEEAEKKFKQVVQAQLEKLDVVSREEFDIQTKVLLRTREKLTKLEMQLIELETRIAEKED